MLTNCVRNSGVAALLVSSGLIMASAVQAQTLLRGPGAGALDPMFQEVLQKPNDVELNLAFARRAIELEDFEAAVGAMERLLIGRSGLPLIRLELGMLYLRLEAPELAEAYFLQVLDSNEIDEEARQRAQILLAETRDANARGSFALSVSLGVKHQSNAVARPVLADFEDQLDLEKEFNNGVPLSPRDAPDSDVGTNASVSLSYSRELDGLTERRFTASLNHYGSFQQGLDAQGVGLDRLDVSVTSLRMGWVLPVTRRGKAPLSIDPFVSANTVNTDTLNNYSSTAMMGVSFNTQLRPNRPFAFSIEAGAKTHGQERDQDIKDASLANMSLTMGHAHQNGNYTSFMARASRIDAETEFESSTGGMINLSHSFRLLGRGLSASVGFSETTRDGLSDRAVLPYRRRDVDMTASLSTSWQIFGVNASLAANYIKRDSTLPVENYDDLAGTLTFSRSFQ